MSILRQRTRSYVSHAIIVFAVISSLPFARALADTHVTSSCLKQSLLAIVHDGKPACSVVVVDVQEPGWLTQHAAKAVTGTVWQWANVELPVVYIRTPSGPLPSGPTLILATNDALTKFPSLVPESDDWVTRVAFLNPQGFACVPVAGSQGSRFLVVGRAPRGVYNGAVYLRDFCIDGSRENLNLVCEPTIRSPHLQGRAVYLLTIWGHEAEYTAADWEKIFDSFARDGFDRIYFWVSGHFPSKKFPQAYKCRDGNFDTTERSRIGTIEDLRRIINAAHERGLKLYAGGALGGWCCTWLLTNGESGTTKTPPKNAPYPGEQSLCPSHPKSRWALIDYYKEIYDALPDADGLFIESADEWGRCECQVCGKRVDEFGSTQFGQSQITLIQEMMHEIWRDHPHARLAYTIGYDEHRKDPAYYELVRQMSDSRIEWMEARDSWTFPDREGHDLPAVYFSRRVMRWRQYYAHPLEQLVKDSQRVAELGFYGCITAFEPGAGTGSFYTQIPYPADWMPYVLTGFVFREATWDPTLTTNAMQQRVQKRFFGADAPVKLGQDLWDLRELIREAAGSRKMTSKIKETLDQIEQRMKQSRRKAGPKTAETLDLMDRAIRDVRSYLK